MNTTNIGTADQTGAGTQTTDARPIINGDVAAAEVRTTRPRKTDADEKLRAKMSPAAPASNKTQLVLKKLRARRGITVEALMQATGWQAHSVRGFLSGTVRKKLGLTVLSEIGKDGARRYRIPSSV